MKKKCIVNEYASYCVNTKQLSTMLIFFQEMYKTLQKNIKKLNIYSVLNFNNSIKKTNAFSCKN